ncbi:MAG TPA: hypothetical protein VEM94_01765 [Candidatus Dormibacteraeota bacterium]|nr:hypothetical protein [Candidatus Dormibacteraeota bacterium]
MSEQDEDLELQALQRELDDAFATTRPRVGFDDELWLRMQARRPLSIRIRDAFAGMFQGIREVPAVPMAAVAGLLVVVIGVGIFAYSGIGRGGGGGTTMGASAPGNDARGNTNLSAGAFGPVPAPGMSATPKGVEQAPPLYGQAPGEYAGPATFVWSGQLDLALSTAPVYRYREPSTNASDQFATALGAALQGRPQGLLGSYSATTYTLKVRGTVQSPPVSPAYFILANVSMPEIDAAGAGPQDLAAIFLAQHSLLPQWTYTVSVDSRGNPVKVIFERQFDVPGYAGAHLVDSNGIRYGLEVDLNGRRPVFVQGLLPVSLDSAPYRIISGDQAIRLATAPSTNSTGSSVPIVQLKQAELVYVLATAGDHSFYEPAFLFSGTVQVNGVTMTRHVLIPAVDPSQRTP